MTTLANLSSGVFGDVLSVLGIPANTATNVFRAFMQRRADEARDILFDALRAGEIDSLNAGNDDEAIAVMYRYYLAVRDGVARTNLRLLAQAMVGLFKRDRLFSEEFNKYAEILSRLSRDEILVIGTLHQYRKAEERRQGPLVGTGQYWPKVLKELVPDQFPTENHVIAVCCAGMRSGLILTPRDFDSTGAYATSPIMDEVAELTGFEEVLVDESETSRVRS